MLQRHKGPLHILPGRVMILLVMLRLGVAHPVRRDKDRNGAVVHRLDDPRAVLLGVLQRQRRQQRRGGKVFPIGNADHRLPHLPLKVAPAGRQRQRKDDPVPGPVFLYLLEPLLQQRGLLLIAVHLQSIAENQTAQCVVVILHQRDPPRSQLLGKLLHVHSSLNILFVYIL